MRKAETILGVIRERGTRGLPLERVYRLLFSNELYLLAYGRLYRNAGALTRGATPDTVDGMSLAKVDRLIDEVRHERHRWTPVRRVVIPKSNGKTRPLGIPTVSAYNRGTPANFGFTGCHPPVPPVARAGIGRVVRAQVGWRPPVCL